MYNKKVFILTNMDAIAPNKVVLNIIKFLDKKRILLVVLNKTSMLHTLEKEFRKFDIEIKSYDRLRDAILDRDFYLKLKFAEKIFANGLLPLIYLLFIKNNNKLAIIHSVLSKEYMIGSQNISLKKKIYFKIHMFLIKRVKFAIGVSKYVGKFLDLYSIPNEVIYNGLDYDRFPILKKDKSQILNFCQTGVICDNKNQMYSLELINYLKKSGILVHLYIFGNIFEKEYFESLHEYIKNNKLENEVSFYHNKDTDEILNNYYNKMDFIIMPSRHEGLSLALLEALYFNICPIVSDDTGMIEIVKDGISGCVVDIYKKDFNRIKSLIESNRYKEYATKSRKNVLKNFTAREMSRKYELI